MTGQAALRKPLYFMTGSLTFAAVLIACISMTAATAQDRVPDYSAIIAAPDRTDADLQTDKRRDPVKLLAFTDARPGMKVLDMGAGGGYSTELMARAVAPTGVVYGQNPADLGERAKTRFEARLKTPAGKNIVSLVRPFDDPVPADVGDLDLITFLFYYHDTTYMSVDRAEMNRKLYAALKAGGLLVIADHSARAGDGTSVGKTFHRIEESVLRREVEAVGFSSSLKATSGATLRIHVTSRSNRQAAERWTSSCSNFRSRGERPLRNTVLAAQCNSDLVSG